MKKDSAKSPAPAVVKSAKKRSALPFTGLINALLVMACLGILSAMAWAGWDAVSNAQASKNSAAQATPSPTPVALKLNQAHTQQGPAITASPAESDRTNPFVAP